MVPDRAGASALDSALVSALVSPWLRTSVSWAAVVSPVWDSAGAPAVLLPVPLLLPQAARAEYHGKRH